MTTGLFVIIGLLGVLLHLERRAHANALTVLLNQFQAERSELISRIQRPEILPTSLPRPPDREQVEQQEKLRREFALVGSVQPMSDDG